MWNIVTLNCLKQVYMHYAYMIYRSHKNSNLFNFLYHKKNFSGLVDYFHSDFQFHL